MTTLVVTSRAPTSRTSGYDLRVAHLCAWTPGPLHLAVVGLEPDDGPGRPAGGTAVAGFDSTHWFDDLRTGDASPRRHLRLSDAHHLRTARPAAYAATTARLETVARELGVTTVVVFGGDVAEVALDVVARLRSGHGAPRVRTVLDVCDSVALTRRRQLEVLGAGGLRARLGSRVALARSRAHEARLPGRVDLVTTISEQDSDELRSLAGPGAEVVTVPNGVDEDAGGRMLPAGDERRVGFWGNLAFGPNQEALRYYLHEVHAPYLREAGVGARIVGPNAPDWLRAHAEQDPLVELTGFVDDLADALTGLPLAVNAMRTGSGLKNKVLEAFAMGLVVVSTTRGIEAVDGAHDGEHVAVADTAAGFADAVVRLLDDPAERERLRLGARALLDDRYRWPRVGARWRDLLPR